MLTRLPVTGFLRLPFLPGPPLYISIISSRPAVHGEADAPLMTRGGSLARVKMLVNGNSAKRLNELVLVAATNTEMWTPAVYIGGVFFFHWRGEGRALRRDGL